MASNVIHVYHEPLANISTVIKAQLYRLNNRGSGRMLGKLQEFYFDRKWDDNHSDDNYHVFYIKGKNNIIKAWAMVHKDHTRRVVDFYTKRSERGKGYGSALAEVVSSNYKKMYGARALSSIFKRYGITSN